MFYFAFGIFLSAFLLFQIQPMIGKFLLPWFGGTPAVWSTVMLFFQVLLTGGYAYAYWLIGRVQTKRQGTLHIFLLGIALAFMLGLGLVWPSPITPSADWRPANVNFPIPHIFLLLLISVGLPYFMLATNGPLMQAWFSRVYPEKSYARLYALSNVGSLLGLLAYPVLIEPTMTLHAQGWAWTIGFVLFAMLIGGIALRTQKREAQLQTYSEPKEKLSVSLRILWIALPGVASIFLLAVTNQITQEVAVIPFLWVLPLALYLLSFVFTFSDGRWYQRQLYAFLFILASLATLWALAQESSLNVVVQISIYSLLLFLACMICHGELYRLRPHASQLTTFYLIVSIGGAVGGIFVNLIAPYIFTGYWEFYLAWLLTVVILVLALLPRLQERSWANVLVAMFVLGSLAIIFGFNHYNNALFARRNFYGILRVRTWQSTNGRGDAFAMIHGVTVHGIQYLAPESHDQPTTYYVPDSGVGLVLLNHPQYGKDMRVGVLGLGAGTLASYGQPGDMYRFYEINPVVIDLAEGEGGYFSFLKDSRANITVVPGDARISLEEELSRNPNGDRFDVLVLDTFTSDSIPVHLVTKEAFQLYLRHLALDGILAAHISNRYLDLQPVFWQLAHAFGLSMVRVDHAAGPDDDGFPSEWILLARDPALLHIPAIQSHSVLLNSYSTNIQLWTDDYSNLFQILK